MHRIIAAVTMFTCLAVTPAAAFECKVCHSKNPAMVKMHQTLQVRPEIGCFDCHKVGEKLMGKAQPKDRDSLLKRRTTESPCLECHAQKAAPR